MTKKTLRSDCPINYGIEAFGDKWSLLVLRDILFYGKKTYGEFLKSDEKIATNILASRLQTLEANGLITKSPHPTDKRKDSYSATQKTLDLLPMLLELVKWSAIYGKNDVDVPSSILDRITNDREQLIRDIMAGVLSKEIFTLKSQG
ncbi:MAG TPA: helix-turn-helix domain-containing protein [Verrucomicrobiae bacterium]|nr:helix-turn-helix domain-containing protein [Verrucomicrobiae bacterium]